MKQNEILEFERFILTLLRAWGVYKRDPLKEAYIEDLLSQKEKIRRLLK